MGVKAKEIIDGKFWILEDNGQKVATLSLSDEKKHSVSYVVLQKLK